MYGKRIRFDRLLHGDKMLCVPLDHGVTNCDIANLSDFRNTVSQIVDNGASSIIVHKGLVRFLPQLKNTGLIVHLSASTENYKPVKKIIVCEVEEAVLLGADAVSIHVNLGNEFEKHMLSDFARISSDCQKYGMPLLAMMYNRNNDNTDIGNTEKEKHSIRIAAEMGADIVKIGSNWSLDNLKVILKDALIPIVIAGGDMLDREKLFALTKNLMGSGILGISFGRNVFMSKNIADTMRNLSSIIYNY
ncbi:MAG: hypothetical protein LBT55_02495 [Clostridiaceae bacterium]|jgi:DhnA family fructose-bisphosphate aldolase class Ia|nr:hypothetical protein [Clostridiaceae bacterium]